MNLVFTSELLVKQITRLLQPYDITPASGLVLSILADSDEPLSPHVIAERLIVTRATVTGLLDSLERRDLAQRVPYPGDRRMVMVAITDVGRQIADEYRLLVHQHQREWFSVLSEEEKQTLIDLLHRVQANLAE